MRRAVALIVAIGLVVGAVVVRRAIDDDEPTADPSQPSTHQPTGVIVCAADLGDVCTAVEGARIELPADTVERLVKGEPLGADAWIVAAPWPAIAIERAARQGRALELDVPDQPVARTPLTFYAAPSVTAGVDQCGTTIDWKCLPTKAARIDFEDPSVSTAGMLAVIQQAMSFFGPTEFGSNDFGLFERELAQLKRARATAPNGATVFERFVFNHADVLVGLGAIGDRQLTRAQLKDKLVARAAAPTVSADVVVAGEPGDTTIRSARKALTDGGWSVEKLPPTTQLPSADVIIALQDLWKGFR